MTTNRRESLRVLLNLRFETLCNDVTIYLCVVFGTILLFSGVVIGL